MVAKSRVHSASDLTQVAKPSATANMRTANMRTATVTSEPIIVLPPLLPSSLLYRPPVKPSTAVSPEFTAQDSQDPDASREATDVHIPAPHLLQRTSAVLGESQNMHI